MPSPAPQVPKNGKAITISGGRLSVPDQPILPFIEGENAWRGGPVVAIGTPHPIFFCPSRRSPQLVTYQDEYTPPVTGTMVTHALGDYGASNWEGTGAVRRQEPVRIAEITDGTSQTLLVSERRLNLRYLGQNQPDDGEGYTAGFDEDTIRSTDRPPRPDFIGEGWDEQRRFGSSHLSGINAVFADGSVRSISFGIDAGLFRLLGHRSDGQTISSDF